jgi:mevalonate kinase
MVDYQYKATAPGKIILFGEHFVVYPGNKAVISSVGLYANVTAKLCKDPSLVKFSQYKNPTYTNKNISFSVSESFECYQKTVSLHKEFQTKQDIAKLNDYMFEDFRFISIICGIAYNFIKNKGVEVKGVEIDFSSDIPFSAGFGSSASISSSIIAGILQAHSIKYTTKQIYELTFEYEKFQHGNPSGGDPAAVVYGDMIEFHKTKSQNKKITSIRIQNKSLQKLLNKCVVLHTGKSEQSTGELVLMVKKAYEKNVETYNQIFKGYRENVNRFLELTKKTKCSESELIHIINTNGLLLEKIGVVSKLGKEICDEIRSNGGGAKVSGSGGTGAGACGALFVYHKDIEFLQKLAKKYKIKLFDIEFAVKGISES